MPIGLSAPPAWRPPLVTAGLVVVVLTVFACALLLRDAPAALFCTDLSESEAARRASDGTVQGLVCRAGAVPDELRHGRGLVTLLTSVFVHTSWWHVVPNVLFLASFGPRVEEDLGHLGMLAVFLGSAVLAGVAHVLVAPLLTAPSIGASGGVAGVLGAHLLLAPRAEVRVLAGPVPVRVPTWFALSLWAALQLVYATVALRRAEYPAGVAYEVHVVGFAVGLAAVAALLRLRPGLRGWPAGRNPASG